VGQHDRKSNREISRPIPLYLLHHRQYSVKSSPDTNLFLVFDN
jgi:hypothetical protein